MEVSVRSLCCHFWASTNRAIISILQPGDNKGLITTQRRVKLEKWTVFPDVTLVQLLPLERLRRALAEKRVCRTFPSRTQATFAGVAPCAGILGNQEQPSALQPPCVCRCHRLEHCKTRRLKSNAARGASSPPRFVSHALKSSGIWAHWLLLQSLTRVSTVHISPQHVFLHVLLLHQDVFDIVGDAG